MDWSGEFVFGSAWAVFRGTAADNTPHAHPTLQIVLAAGTEAQIEVPGSKIYRGTALLVRPQAVHLLKPIDRVTLVFIEPQTSLAYRLLQEAPDGPVVKLQGAAGSSLTKATSLEALCENLSQWAQPSSETIDRSVEHALRFLAEATGPRIVARAAAAAGLSTSRLRERARSHLGTPLSNWLMWRRLERAGAALGSGASLAEAAFEAGFADQAHLSRATRQVFGITPRMASGLVRTKQANPSRRD